MGSEGFALAAHFILNGRSEMYGKREKGVLPDQRRFRASLANPGGDGNPGDGGICAGGPEALSADGGAI